ncbi:putative armadillo-like helical, leucine-rich repeat domain superfamily, protein ARABIDILLO [Helianthus annuus]|nr:putative armadillo-like helical, leucine-rich repeat domain superfamily, protein ARABIDILLO [Helianthus annuus]
MLTLIVACYKLLESIQLWTESCEMITSDGIYSIALCCPNLKKLRLSGILNVSYEAIRALADRCPNLHDIGFIDCLISAVFSDWRNGSNKNEANLDDLMSWVELILSHALLRIAEANLIGLDQFWLDQGAGLLLTLLQINDISIKVDAGRVKAVRKGGGVQLLLRLARSLNEGLQLEATKAIANLSANPAFARSVAGEGGITVLASLAKSTNRFVAEEAAGGLWNLSAGDKHMERAAGALADLVAVEKYSMEVAAVGALVATLANLTGHGDSNTNNVMVGQEDGVIDVLILLIGSQHHAVRKEAATAFWHLSNDARNREQIALHGGVEALERAAGALWGLSVSEANRYTQISYLIFLAQHDIFIVGANWFTNLFRCI